ncbi:helix-turn-helix transcriptional regulator [Verrucomicrobiaceae bacterium N1E253]|uniref:Helix-turn-helix transcriptional regulator n=1 Tax=Oceaniferula marina TaxID=2748318 RepID=A0A851GIJ7_9BACT|nr:AraC family transcriptional regulator [Oceaniferula marina]NWK54450.1 helix-turn-helix transcriptional regulator [Oceaniferula marina]
MPADDWLDLNSTQYRTIIDLRNHFEGDLTALGHYHYDRAMPPIPEQSSSKRLVFGFLISGLQRYRMDGQDLILRGGQGIRFMPGSVYSSAGLPEQRGEFYWLVVEAPKRRQIKLPGFKPEAANRWWSRATDTDLPGRFPISEELRRRLIRLFNADLQDQGAMMETQLSMDCGLLLLSLYQVLAESLDQHTSAEVMKTLQYMEHHLSDMDLDAHVLASVAGLSPSRYHTRFKNETGLPPAEYLRHRRVIEAQRLLAQANAPQVTDLAMALGFSSSQYFATVFKRYTRLSPSQWRTKYTSTT